MTARIRQRRSGAESTASTPVRRQAGSFVAPASGEHVTVYIRTRYRRSAYLPVITYVAPADMPKLGSRW